MICRIWHLDNGKDMVAGEITLKNGVITVKGEQPLMDNILNEKNSVDGGRSFVSAKSDPERWMRSLPATYKSWILRAELL
jgi:hypothetical protein